jgi:plasmid stabilization system protein ParE
MAGIRLSPEAEAELDDIWLYVAMNNMAKIPFELSVRISRARLKPHPGTGIVES